MGIAGAQPGASAGSAGYRQQAAGNARASRGRSELPAANGGLVVSELGLRGRNALVKNQIFGDQAIEMLPFGVIKIVEGEHRGCWR